MNDPKREIVNQVAAGTITAEEGAARLEALESQSSSAPASPAARPPAGQASTGVKVIKLLTRFGNAEVIGDPTVSTAVADGPHRARQEGDTMVIEQSFLNDETSFAFSRPGRRMNIPGLPEFGSRLTVRMNPALALSATVQAGNLQINGLKGSVDSNIQAGNCEIVEFRGPIGLHVTAGNVTANGRLDAGASTIRCEMGEVHVALDKTSSVRIRARSTMGEVAVDGEGKQENNEFLVGSGAGTLDCSCTMGSVRVTVE
jgi:hypothetical protein